MKFPGDLKYSRTHEWVRIEKDEVVIGISAYASEELGDITYVELPEEGEDVEKDTAFGVIESVKTSADLYSPVSGKVVETNLPLEDSPEVINDDSYGDGWLIRVLLSDASELDELMNVEEYQEFVEEEQEP